VLLTAVKSCASNTRPRRAPCARIARRVASRPPCPPKLGNLKVRRVSRISFANGEHSQMRLIRSVARRMLDAFGYRILPTAKADSEGLPPDYSPQMVELFRAVEPFTMTSPERIGSLVNAVEYVVHNRIAGEIVECGVWRGGSMMAVAHTLTRLRHTKKDLLLFDTFEGMPPPGAVDRDLRGNAAADLMGTQDRSTSWMWGVAQLDEVRSNMHSTQYELRIRSRWRLLNKSRSSGWIQIGTSQPNMSSCTSSPNSQSAVFSLSTTTGTGKARGEPLTSTSMSTNSESSSAGSITQAESR
jgi:hypothetical protein